MVNPGFQAFLELKKYIAEKLGVSNGPIAAKVAGAVQKDMKDKHPGMDAVSLAAEGRKHFDKNVNNYKQMIPITDKVACGGSKEKHSKMDANYLTVEVINTSTRIFITINK